MLTKERRKEFDLLWEELGEIPCTDEGMIEEPFRNFPVGTDREDIWRWIEGEFDVTIYETNFFKRRTK